MEDRRGERIISDTIAKVDGHYCVGLLWRQAEPKLPFNRQMAEIRLRHLELRLERDERLHEKYRSVIDEYIAMGHARKLTREEAAKQAALAMPSIKDSEFEIIQDPLPQWAAAKIKTMTSDNWKEIRDELLEVHRD